MPAERESVLFLWYVVEGNLRAEDSQSLADLHRNAVDCPSQIPASGIVLQCIGTLHLEFVPIELRASLV